jgi:CheY-like chemotaxis protein
MLTEEKKTHILLGEDDNEDILFFELAVRLLPVAVLLTTAENGEKLMEMLEKIFPDIIFLDINMPCKTGRECLREIRANKKYDNIPIIMYTSYQNEENIEDCFRKGANLYLVKPNNIRELVDRIGMILSIDWKSYSYFPQKDKFVISPQA